LAVHSNKCARKIISARNMDNDEGQSTPEREDWRSRGEKREPKQRTSAKGEQPGINPRVAKGNAIIQKGKPAARKERERNGRKRAGRRTIKRKPAIELFNPVQRERWDRRLREMSDDNKQ
jgi:hypothetical protein